MLKDMKSLLLDAEKENRAVGAFSVGNMEMVMGAIKAAEAAATPIILQIAEKRFANSPFGLMAPMMLAAAEASSLPVAVHLDHGITMDCVQAALSAGFTSVMLDASLLPLQENIELTQRVVALATAQGATTEAELGVLGGNNGESAVGKQSCTNPAEAELFCRETGIDCLAVAIGNAHGNYPRLPELNFEVLEEIHGRVSVPLVLHGGTGITPEQFRRCIDCGVRKINIATASFDALAKAAGAFSAVSDKPDYFGLSKAMVNAVYDNVSRHIEIFNNR